MKKSLLFLTAGCLSLILFLSGCQTVSVQADTPEGFADISESADYYSDVVPYRAISPEGVIFRVRSVDNYPEKGIDFWPRPSGCIWRNRGINLWKNPVSLPPVRTTESISPGRSPIQRGVYLPDRNRHRRRSGYNRRDGG